MNTLKAIHVILQRVAWFGMEHQDDRELNDAIHELGLAGTEVDPNRLFQWATASLQQEPPEKWISGSEKPYPTGSQEALLEWLAEWREFIEGVEEEAERDEVGPRVGAAAVQRTDEQEVLPEPPSNN